MVSARPQFEAACQLQKFCWSSTVAVQRACTSPTSVRFTRPAPDLMAGLAEWLRHRIVAPVTRVRFSHLAPFIRGLRRQAAAPSPTARAGSALALAHPAGRFV